MNNLPWLATLILALILIAIAAGGFYLQKEMGIEVSKSKEDIIENPSEFTVDEFDSEKHEIKTLAKVGNKSLFIATLLYSPALFLSDDTTGNVIRLGVVDYIDEALLWSPDKKHLLLAVEEEVIVVDTETLEYEKVFSPTEGTLHGLLSSYPSFHPRVRWLSNSEIEVILYPTDKFYAEEPNEPEPLERQIITL